MSEVVTLKAQQTHQEGGVKCFVNKNAQSFNSN